MFGLGTKELIIIALILVLLFGSTQIPALAKGIAEAIKGIKAAFKGDHQDDKTDKK